MTICFFHIETCVNISFVCVAYILKEKMYCNAFQSAVWVMHKYRQRHQLPAMKTSASTQKCLICQDLFLKSLSNLKQNYTTALRHCKSVHKFSITQFKAIRKIMAEVWKMLHDFYSQTSFFRTPKNRNPCYTTQKW